MRRIHLMTIKVFTTPRRTPHFEIWRLRSPAACTGDVAVSHLLPPSPFRSPPLSNATPLPPLPPLPYSFSRVLAERSTRSPSGRRGADAGEGREGDLASPSYQLHRFSILFTTLVPRAPPAIIRSESANARTARRQIGGNRRRNVV
jgi:hypothetical protein